MGVGRGIGPDAYRAAATAAREAVVGAQAQLLIVFAAVTHEPAAIVAALRDVAPGVPVIGCSTGGEISPAGSVDGSVTVAALGGPGFAVSTAAARQAGTRQRQAGAEVATCAERVADLPHRVLVLLTDGMMPNQETVLRGCYGTLGASIPLFGGAAGDGWRMDQTYLIEGGSVLTDAVVAATIASEAPMSVGVRHGWRPTGEPMIVTGSADGRVYTLDDEPALDVYLARQDAPPAAYTDPREFARFAVTRPLGVQRRGGIEARSLTIGVDLVNRSIAGGSTINHGMLTWNLAGDTESILDATDAAAQQALAGLDGAPPLGMLGVSCAALRPVLGEEGVREENERFAKWSEGRPYAGFHGYGEIARVHGIDGYHNQSVAVLALS
jgi:hypothetical protein